MSTIDTRPRFDIATLALMQDVWSENYDGELTVVGLSFGQVSCEAVASGLANPIEARLSADGKGWVTEWERGSGCGQAVYVERHEPSGCVFHGWVDAESRRIVQTG